MGGLSKCAGCGGGGIPCSLLSICALVVSGAHTTPNRTASQSDSRSVRFLWVVHEKAPHLLSLGERCSKPEEAGDREKCSVRIEPRSRFTAVVEAVSAVPA